MKRFSKGETGTTLRQVAEAAGVSVATASYALSDTGRVGAETRRRVLETAERLGFEPHWAARALKGTGGQLVAIVTDGLAGPWYGELLEGLQRPLTEAGRPVLALTTQPEALGLTRQLVAGGLVSAVVVLNPGAVDPGWLASLTTTPLVLLGRDAPEVRARRLALDNTGGIEALVDHLWQQGHRKFGFLAGDEERSLDAVERRTAWQASLTRRGVSHSDQLVVSTGFGAEAGYRALTNHLALDPTPRAWVACHDESAFGALRVQPYAVAGFDGLEASAWVGPGLTTVAYDRRAVGRRLAELTLVEPSCFPDPEAIATSLVIRDSTRRLAAL